MIEALCKYGFSAALAAIAIWGYCRSRGISLRGEMRSRPWTFACAWIALTISVSYGGSKGKYVVVNDPYIADAGSFVTNSYVHVEITKRTPLLPDDTEILVYAREASSTNAADWVRIEPYLVFSDHPFNYPFEDATNYNFMVAANYIPAPTIRTNGVWAIAGFVVPASGGKMAFKQTKTETREEHEDE